MVGQLKGMGTRLLNHHVEKGNMMVVMGSMICWTENFSLTVMFWAYMIYRSWKRSHASMMAQSQ